MDLLWNSSCTYCFLATNRAGYSILLYFTLLFHERPVVSFVLPLKLKAPIKDTTWKEMANRVCRHPPPLSLAYFSNDNDDYDRPVEEQSCYRRRHSFDARKQRKFVEREKRRKIGGEEKRGCTKLTTEVNKILMSPVPPCSTSVSPSDWLSALARWWLTRSRHHTSTSEHRTSTTSKTEGWDKVDPAAPPKRSAFDSFKRWRYCKHREKTNDFSLSFFFLFLF